MRVISGQFRGRKLKARDGLDVRPTTDKVKEAVFNIIQSYIYDSAVLDLFAGSGQLGIECISRGACCVTFIDSDIKSVKTVKDNLTSCGISASLHCTDALKFLSNCEKKYDIIFIDPPYDADLYEKVLEKIVLFDILNEGGIIVCESRCDKVIELPGNSVYIHKEYIYGQIKVTLIRKSNPDSE